MIYKTIEGILTPDGRLELSPDDIPEQPVRVMVTIMEGAEETTLSDVGDYHEQLTDYEERLARGEIQWQ